MRDVIEILQTQSIEAYLVGGAVRDLLLCKETSLDLDFAVPTDGLAVARRIAQALNAAFYPLDSERAVGRVIYDAPNPVSDLRLHKYYLDFATFRGATLQEDLLDRDFTINAMALRIAEPSQLIDPLNGWQDLEAGRIRATSAEAFSHDPIRILRAVRQAVDLHFAIEAETEHYLRQTAPRLAASSPERQRDELVKLLNTPAPGQAVETLHRLGVLPHILPEVEAMAGVTQSAPHHLDVFRHTTAALDAWAVFGVRWPMLSPSFQVQVEQYLQQVLTGELSLKELMPLAVLLHDTGKPLTRSQATDDPARVRFLEHERESAKIVQRVMRRLRFSGQALSFVETVVANHMRPFLLTQAGGASRRAIHRLFRDTDEKGYQAGVAVALHALVDQEAIYPPHQGQAEAQALLNVVNQLLAAYFEQRQQVISPPPLLTGHDIMKALAIGEGRLVGRLLERLREGQAIGQIQNKAEALEFIRAALDSLNDSVDESNKD